MKRLNDWAGVFMLLAALASVGTLAADDAVPRSGPSAIEVFVRAGCPHCAEAEQFLHTLQQEQPGLIINYHDVLQDPAALQRLKALAESLKLSAIRVPAIFVGGQLIIGYSKQTGTDALIREALRQAQTAANEQAPAWEGSCEAVSAQSCDGAEGSQAAPANPPPAIRVWGYELTPEQLGLPAFTLAMGLLDGFNPCSIWVLLLMISLLAPMQNRGRMLAVAGAFVAVEGIAYFVFMAAWLNLFLFIGLSRISEIAVAVIALAAAAINLKDFWHPGRGGVSLSIPASAKPGIYARMRAILSAQNLVGAMIGAVFLAVLVQIVEFMCTSGFPALYTRILTLHGLDKPSYYGYLVLYNAAYMLDDIIILAIGVITLSQHRLQENEGRWLKLLSGLVMAGLGLYLLLNPA
ncbi:MAG: NrdH-redoxin [Methylobacter sp.]|nr:MAG: NrdH-redoxin [Methylobacter sp.]